jgi:hypothetical protein
MKAMKRLGWFLGGLTLFLLFMGYMVVETVYFIQDHVNKYHAPKPVVHQQPQLLRVAESYQLDTGIQRVALGKGRCQDLSELARTLARARDVGIPMREVGKRLKESKTSMGTEDGMLLAAIWIYASDPQINTPDTVSLVTFARCKEALGLKRDTP